MALATLAFAAVLASIASEPASTIPPAARAASTATAATMAPTNAPDTDPMVCKSIAVTGTRFPTKVCARKSEWADRSQAAREYADHMSRTGMPPGH